MQYFFQLVKDTVWRKFGPHSTSPVFYCPKVLLIFAYSILLNHLMPMFLSYVMLCAIWYNFHNLKNVKNTNGRVLRLAKLQNSASNFIKSNTYQWVFLRFLICANGSKLYKASHIETLQFIAYVNQFIGFYIMETST